MNDLEVVAELFDLDDEDAMIVLGLCDWVDHQIAIARHGYPRDNVIAPPIAERLADPEYLARLARIAREDEEVPPRILQALVEKLDACR